jgi:hypothetical protein
MIFNKKTVLSCILGFWIGYVLYKKKMTKVKGPNSNSVKKNIYYDKNNSKCFVLTPNPVICPLSQMKKKTF